ncbi:MAG: DUF4177 domain-containing protein [Candidatus Didemnitutus sp.]|nr:DUF4177 domain-containing protein [Candidatus Didemnitutus sp.]
MSNWEYKVITSGKGGFASPALLEKFLNDLGQEGWEIINFHTQPDNLLAFTGLVRRTTQRDWTLEDAAAAAARAEADKLRAEFEAKFKAGNSNAPAQSAEEAGDTFLAEEKVGADDGLRRLRDTSRDDDRDAAEEEGGEKEDDWDKLAEEDELPTFFDAMRPHMRKNQRGPGMSVGVDYLAKKWKMEESDIKGALVECGLQIPADENAKPVYVEFEGDIYWVNINRRGEIWINTREKPEPVFRIAAGKRLSDEEAPIDPAAAQREERRQQQETRAERQSDVAAQPRESQPNAAPQGAAPTQPPAPKTFLDKVRGLMRRNRRGHGWSGSFGFLTKALRTDDAGLLAQLAEQGLKMKDDGVEKPLFHEEGDFLYWMDKNQRGEIWINARKNRGGQKPDGTDAGGDEAAEPGAPESAVEPTGAPAATASPAPVESTATAPEPASAPVPATERVRADTLEALRLLLQPKKRGDGVTAKIDDLSTQIGRPAIEILEALVAAGLNVPDDAKAKPTFGERNGEIFWLNRNAKGDLWLNAKDSKAKRARSKKKDEGEDSSDDDGSSED